jgi:pyruvate kinase
VDGGRGLEALQEELSALGGGQLGVVLKIGTLEALAHLPCLLLTAMGRPQPVGVMIAREDLAAECGWEGLAALEQEILRLCAAAHVPCLRAAQGLEQAAPIAASVDLLRQTAAASLRSQPEHPGHLKPLLSRVRFDTGC